MNQTVLMQIQIIEPEDYKQTKADYDSSIAIALAVNIVVLFIGIAIGWFLHKQKVKKYKRRVSSRKIDNRINSNQ